MDDAALLERIAAGGDKSAMKLLYERHSDALYHFIRARLRDPFEAADVMQEVFLEVWRAAGRFQGRSAARTWIFGIARNKTVDRMRRGDLARLSAQTPRVFRLRRSPKGAATTSESTGWAHTSSTRLDICACWK